ncbi:MAG: glycoside hydrolase family 3 C-terminal domain-containing protein [Clostridiales bacterium]|nr:glycoside hydrolase family 3 C-terminal domain-containing protein [Clostridiales bacterium]
MSLKEKIVVTATKIGMKVAGVSQEENKEALSGYASVEGMSELARKVAAEGAVLLKNEGVLPYKEGSKISVFGRCQNDWFFTGYGSGGDVIKPYAITLIDGLNACDILSINEELAKEYKEWCDNNPIDHGVWAHWPRSFPEMSLDEKAVESAAQNSDSAVYIIGRSSGEDRENVLEKGSYYLTDEEKNILTLLSEHFDKITVLLNIGSIIDMSWLKDYGDKIGAVLIVWQGGMESGNAIADILSGKVSPCGKLSDTIAKSYTDYLSSSNFGNKEFNIYQEDIYLGYRGLETFAPDKVLYPFGYGLSYTTFSFTNKKVKMDDSSVSVSLTVKNTGTCPGKEAVMLYLEKPNARLGNPARELVAFAKTKELAPGESERVELKADKYLFASYDDCGETEYIFSYVIEEGVYSLYIGTDVKSAEKIWSYMQENTELYEQLKQVSAPKEPFMRMVRSESGAPCQKQVLTAQYDLKEIILDNIPEAIQFTGDKGYTIDDVKNGNVSMEDFVAQLTDYELEALSRGDFNMDSPLGVKGNAGALGGVIKPLRDKGIAPLITTDGPSGIRLLSQTSLIPIGTLLASTFDTPLVESLYTLIGKEMALKGSDILLAPGLNIHRDPLCGRNFEYFSEDPLLSGRMAAAVVRGVQSQGLSACPKHFACNNQEFNRTHNDSRLSERALRQIYLRSFEITVKESAPKCIMTSYNKINGVWGHYNYELCQRILRDEWGFDGLVMTDWWMRSSKSPEFPNIRNNAYRVRSSVDVLMPGAKKWGSTSRDRTLLETLGKKDGITLGEIQRTAIRVIEACTKIKG